MNTTKTYEELTQYLPVCTSSLRPDPSSRPGSHISHPADAPANFIPPNFSEEEGDSTLTAQVLLIAAPAAVGKSWLAQHLSASTANPLWDLSQFNVGSGFFTGTITDAYGPGGFSEISAGLRQGSMCLILDAADEALVRAGTGSFEAALENLAHLIGRDQNEHPSVVILGRQDTIQDSVASLNRLGVTSKVWDVSFFDETQTRHFVRTKSVSTPFRLVDEIEPFMTTFFSQVQTALGATRWEDSQSFLGYAPVLDALATFYKKEENPLKKLNALARDTSNKHVWDLLIEIISAVAGRESEKFANIFGDGDIAKEAFARETYSERLQIEMLLSEDPSAIPIPISDDCNSDWLEDLEQKVAGLFREHPFIGSGEATPRGNPLLRFANAAFRDYAIAYTLKDASSIEATRLSSLWRATSVNPSPMFSRFAFSEALAPAGEISAETLAMIADSHSSSFSNKDVLLAIFDFPEFVNEEFTGRRDIKANLGTHSVVLRANLLISEPLQFTGSLAQCLIFTPDSNVVLGSGSADFVIGPSTFIVCSTLSSESTELRVAYDGRQVSIFADQIAGFTRKIATVTPDSLMLSIPTATYPWQQYLRKATDAESRPLDSDLRLAGLNLRKLIDWFSRQSMGPGNLSYPKTTMDSILSKGRAPREMFDYCDSVGALSKTSAEYILKFSFPVPVIKSIDLTNGDYLDFLTGYVRWKRAKSTTSSV